MKGIEQSKQHILEVLTMEGQTGFQIAKAVSEKYPNKSWLYKVLGFKGVPLMPFGTLYRALDLLIIDGKAKRVYIDGRYYYSAS